ncbi:MAG: carboxymethylenebutenolidase [Methylocystaceae bacterium]|nr:MAG: carboxymethylenebutenolidase [Methylocystaceae bacterium]
MASNVQKPPERERGGLSLSGDGRSRATRGPVPRKGLGLLASAFAALFSWDFVHSEVQALSQDDKSAAGAPAGFAPAAGAPRSSTITTDARGLATGDVEIATANGKLPAYFAKPEKGENFPVILVVQEIFGVHEHIRDVARRLAKLGYFAIAPELYFRHGDPAKAGDIPQVLREIVAKVPGAEVLSDLDSALAFAGAQGGDVSRAAITGFCWGGRIVWLYAAHNPKLKAGIAWYGRLAGEANERTPRFPVDVAGELKVPVLGLYGGADQGIPLDTVERLRAALKAHGAPGEIVVYEGAPHAFFADYRESYRKEPAEDGWRRLVDWFARHGVK